MAKTCFLVWVLLLSATVSFAKRQNLVQNDTIAQKRYVPMRARVTPEFLAKQKQVTDSIMRATWILPDSMLKSNILIDSVEKAYLFPTLDLWAWQQKYKSFKKTKDRYLFGDVRAKGNPVFLEIVFLTLLLFGVLKYSFPQQFSSIFLAFYTKRGFAVVSKEESLLNSWPFLFLFLLFGLVFAMFLFLVAQHYQVAQAQNALTFLFGASALIVMLFTAKLLSLRFLGFLFNLQKPVRAYISIIYLSYFNISILFIPLIIAFALNPFNYANVFITLGCLIFVSVFVSQLIRVRNTILSVNKFSKIHLILYFCCLEICPILILVKAIGLK